jgi:osmotically-inducible protein OsmY
MDRAHGDGRSGAGGTLRTDSQVKQAVLRELERDTRVDEIDVDVEVNVGVVTLTGTVTSWAKRIAAQEAAHRAFGVLDVANGIQVTVAANSSRTDAEVGDATRRSETDGASD